MRNVSLRVRRAERLVLLGPSGSGKTTLLKLANRLHEPTNGSVRFNGVDTRDMEPLALRRSMGYVIQQTGLFPHMTVGQNVGLPLRLLAWGKEKIRARTQQVLALVRLPPKLLDRYPRQLSGGQQQRVGLARALAGNPGILLMDEPFGALDPMNRIQIRREVLALLRKIGKTVIMVTHDLSEAWEMADRIAILHRGRLEQVDTVPRLRSNPASAFVRRFLSQTVQA